MAGDRLCPSTQCDSTFEIARLVFLVRNFPAVAVQIAPARPPSGGVPLSDKVRILASSGAKRSPIAPDVPTFAELGYPQIQGDGWIAFHAPARTPKAVIERLSAALAGAIRSADVSERLLKLGFEPVGSSPDELARRMAEDRAKWAPIVKASGFSVDQ